MTQGVPDGKLPLLVDRAPLILAVPAMVHLAASLVILAALANGALGVFATRRFRR